MHELSVARGILDIVSEAVPPGQLRNVRSIRVEIGELSGVSSESLEFSFAAIIHDTPLAKASLALKDVPFVIRCNQCQTTARVRECMPLCPRCSSTSTTVISGNELQVVDLELCEEQS